MDVRQLSTIRVAKPWGMRDLPKAFAGKGRESEPIGEIWYGEGGTENAPLLVKYLFTSERLSIQVHPDDEYAQQKGYACGKEECWIVLDAAPGATIGLGLTHRVSVAELQASISDGSIEQLLDWKPVKTGDVIYVPAGTIHAIGADIVLVEVQQNVDLTYRLYDYGRPRELHLEDGIAVSKADSFAISPQPEIHSPGISILTQGGKFVVENWEGPLNFSSPGAVKQGWVIPLSVGAILDRCYAEVGECWEINRAVEVTLKKGARALFAYAGGEVAGDE